MAYIINKSGGDFQQGGDCLNKPISGIKQTPKNPWMSTGLRNKSLKSRLVNLWQWCCTN